MPAHTTLVITVGEALAVESCVQSLHHIVGDILLVQGSAVNTGDGGHILRPFHPAFQLNGSHTHGTQILQMFHKTVVLQTKGILILPVGIAVALTAGLGAAATVAGATSDDGGQVALAAIAHTQSTVGKHFNFNGGVGADVGNFLPAQFPAENHPAHAHGSAELYAGQGVNGHLGGAVKADLGSDLLAKADHIQILHDEGIHTAGGSMADQFCNSRSLPVRNQGVQSQVNGNTPNMAVLHCLGQSLRGKILCTLTGVKHSAAQIHGVGTVLHRGAQGLHRPGGSQ